MNKNIRSSFIKELTKDSKRLSETLQESSQNIVKTLFEEALTSSISNMVNSEDEEEEQEPQTEEPQSEEVEVVDIESGTEDLETIEQEYENDDEVEEGNEDEGTWEDLEDYIDDESGEYDLTNMDDEQVVRVLKVMKPGDGVRVLKREDGDIELEVDDTEFVIELDSEEGEEIVENKLMVKPNTNKDTKRFVRDTPFDNEAEKEFIIELNEDIIEDDDDLVNEITSVTTNGPQARGVTKTHGTNNLSRPIPRNGSVAGVKRKSTSDAMYSPIDENLKRKSDKLMLEHKKLKRATKNILEKLKEAVVVNSALSHTVKLVMENSTTLEEKKYIVNTFDKAKSVEDTERIYESLKREFNSKVSTNKKPNINSKVQIVENKAMKSDKLVTETVNPIKDLMQRLDKIK